MPWIYLGYILKYMKANSKAFILQKYMHNMKITLYVTLTKLPSINKIAFGFLSLTVFPVYYILYKKTCIALLKLNILAIFVIIIDITILHLLTRAISK